MAQRGPPAGITIIDLSRILAGPYCTLLLVELAARVLSLSRSIATGAAKGGANGSRLDPLPAERNFSLAFLTWRPGHRGYVSSGRCSLAMPPGGAYRQPKRRAGGRLRRHYPWR